MGTVIALLLVRLGLCTKKKTSDATKLGSYTVVDEMAAVPCDNERFTIDSDSEDDEKENARRKAERKTALRNLKKKTNKRQPGDNTAEIELNDLLRSISTHVHDGDSQTAGDKTQTGEGEVLQSVQRVLQDMSAGAAKTTENTMPSSGIENLSLA
jgi:hypothetical protein